MRSIFLSVLTLLFAGASFGQDTTVVVDTLDWHRYYPLEIGNTWEYGDLDQYVSTIVGDTLANGHRYFIRRDSVLAVGTVGPFIQTFYTRYDTAGTVVTLTDLDADTLEVPLPFDFWRVSPDFLAHFDLLAAFGGRRHRGQLYRCPRPGDGEQCVPAFEVLVHPGDERKGGRLAVVAAPAKLRAGRRPLARLPVTECPGDRRRDTIVRAVRHVLGRRVAVLADAPRPAGTHRLGWTAPEMAAGLYLLRLETPTATLRRTLVHMR